MYLINAKSDAINNKAKKIIKGGTTVNTLILSLCLEDFFSCIGLSIMFTIKIITLDWIFNDDVISNVRCIVIESYLISSIGLVGAAFGKIVIAVERYVKIVHSVTYRKMYRPWMIKTAIAGPWIVGVLSHVYKNYFFN